MPVIAWDSALTFGRCSQACGAWEKMALVPSIWRCRPRISSIWPIGCPVARAITSGVAPVSASAQIAAWRSLSPLTVTSRSLGDASRFGTAINAGSWAAIGSDGAARVHGKPVWPRPRGPRRPRGLIDSSSS